MRPASTRPLPLHGRLGGPTCQKLPRAVRCLLPCMEGRRAGRAVWRRLWHILRLPGGRHASRPYQGRHLWPDCDPSEGWCVEGHQYVYAHADPQCRHSGHGAAGLWLWFNQNELLAVAVVVVGEGLRPTAISIIFCQGRRSGLGRVASICNAVMLFEHATAAAAAIRQPMASK